MKNNDKHKIISYIKSGVRIGASILSFILLFFNLLASLTILTLGYGVAEIIGILEECIGTEK